MKVICGRLRDLHRVLPKGRSLAKFANCGRGDRQLDFDHQSVDQNSTPQPSCEVCLV